MLISTSAVSRVLVSQTISHTLINEVLELKDKVAKLKRRLRAIRVLNLVIQSFQSARTPEGLLQDIRTWSGSYFDAEVDDSGYLSSASSRISTPRASDCQR